MVRGAIGPVSYTHLDVYKRQGISIEGKSLSNVIIFRLPFPVPDPILEYKCSVAKDALMDVRVPEMIIIGSVERRRNREILLAGLT